MDPDNAQQVAYWAGGGGERWANQIDRLDGEMRALGLRALDALAVAEGSTVLEVGPGTGAATVDLAKRVGPSGRIIGVDISPPLIEKARQTAARHGLDNVTILHADASQVTLEEPVDAVFSRLGVMFFTDPTAAFANLRRNTKPGGRIGFASWQSQADNPWFGAASNALHAAAGLPSPQPDPDVPGVFALADVERVRAIMEGADWQDVVVSAEEHELTLDAEQVEIRLASALSYAPEQLKQADPAVQEKAALQAREAIMAFERDGAVRFLQKFLVVTGRA